MVVLEHGLDTRHTLGHVSRLYTCGSTHRVVVEDGQLGARVAEVGGVAARVVHVVNDGAWERVCITSEYYSVISVCVKRCEGGKFLFFDDFTRKTVGFKSL